MRDGSTYRPQRWQLGELIAASDGAELETALDDVTSAAAKLAACRDELVNAPARSRFHEILALREQLERAQRRVDGYAQLWLSEDTRDPQANALRARVERLLAETTNQTLFFELWWKGLDDDEAAMYAEASGEYTYYLETLRRERPHTLSEAEETLINTKNVTGVDALRRLYEMQTTGFTYPLEVDGELQELTRAEVMARAHDPSSAMREAAYRSLLGRFEGARGPLGTIFHAVASDWDTEHVSLRGYRRPISRRNAVNDLSDEVVDLVLDVCRENAPLFQRYFAAKAKHLGLPVLRRWDLYAPLAEADRRYPFDDAVRLILDALGPFSSEMAAMAERVLLDEHLDAEPRLGKASGAFCYGVLPEITPWVLVSYVEQLDDVSTLAHELGHAIHAQMGRAHPALTSDPSLPLAETASVFSEILLLEKLLEVETPIEAQREILGRFIDGAYATVLRQAYFVLFENAAHEMVRGGKATTEDLAACYVSQLREQFGDHVTVDEAFRWEWLCVPHIFAVPFYCYAYSFGQLLVLSLYRAYQQEGASFVPRYARILSHGGAAGPVPVLAEAGIDISSRQFWQGGFDVLGEFIDRVTQL